MAEPMARIEGVFTYTYDQFTVFFYDDHVYIGGKEFPIGQCVVDVMDLDESVLDEIDRRVRELVPVAQALLAKKNRQRRRSRAGAAERCLGSDLHLAGVPELAHGRGEQLPHL